jgi:hypothetical protein
LTPWWVRGRVSRCDSPRSSTERLSEPLQGEASRAGPKEADGQHHDHHAEREDREHGGRPGPVPSSAWSAARINSRRMMSSNPRGASSVVARTCGIGAALGASAPMRPKAFAGPRSSRLSIGAHARTGGVSQVPHDQTAASHGRRGAQRKNQLTPVMRGRPVGGAVQSTMLTPACNAGVR